MQTPLKLTLKGWKDKGDITELVEEKISKLDRICDDIISCHVTLEQIQNNQHVDHSYNIHIEARIAPQHHILVKKDPKKGQVNHTPLSTLLIDAFDSLYKQTQEIVDRKRNKVKTHIKDDIDPQELYQEDAEEEIYDEK
ncbi:MAG: HPF/RaiA family ribosome-associated protein [Candidatus Zapsychrus exili]|nr:HPF/RaiA family ribosome-associated protein [Candidatus Zapsychrus exili]